MVNANQYQGGTVELSPKAYRRFLGGYYLDSCDALLDRGVSYREAHSLTMKEMWNKFSHPNAASILEKIERTRLESTTLTFENLDFDLKQGKQVQFRHRGNSMTPKIQPGQLVTLAPLSSEESVQVQIESGELRKGSIVYCKVRGARYVHTIKQIDSAKGRVLIADAKGRENGWTSFANVFGVVTLVES